MRTKILVTGATGQLGKTINELYSSDAAFEFVFTTKAQLDITEPNKVDDYFSFNKFHYCINCAAYTNVEGAESNPDEAFKVNAEAVKYLASTCKENKIILIQISTDYVFDGEKDAPYNEKDKTNPLNEYGKSKLAGEQYIQAILDEYFIIRTSWLYSKYGNNFLKTIIAKIQNQEKITITTSQTGAPTSCIDLTQFIFKLIKNRENNYGIYHFSASGQTTWFDYALQIGKLFEDYDCKKIVPVSLFNSKAQRPRYSILDNSKASKIIKERLHWKERVDETTKLLIAQ
jgi:dTDP-4-dehydrorhamnose reductase